MTEFIFNESFRHELRESAHHYGEVVFLESVLHPGMVAMEIGANRGVTAVAIAKAVGDAGQVHAFEPVPEFFGVLEGNVARNAVGNIRAYNLALSNQTGSIVFYKHGTGSGVTPADDAEKVRVEATTIPEWLSTHCVPTLDFINMDCEGSELLVLQNAQAVLEKYAPGIFCEIHRGYLQTLGQSLQDIVDFLTGLGYVVKPIQVEDLKIPSDFDQCSHIYASFDSQGGNGSMK